MKKKTILIDFDGTINSYQSGWQGATELPDPPNPGAISFLKRLIADPNYEPMIFTTRVWEGHEQRDSADAVQAIRVWLHKHGLDGEELHQLDITAEKRPCKLIIDDNCFRFEGEFPTPDELRELTK